MNIKDYFEKHNNQTLTGEEWEQIAQAMITEKFDREKRDSWSRTLQGMGVYRKSNGTFTFRSNIRKFMAAAAVLLVVFTAGWYFFLRSPLTDAQNMASNLLEVPYRLNTGGIRGEESMEQNRGKAFQSYDQKNYEDALTYLRIIEAEGQAKADDYFTMGLCLMYQKEPDYARAINAFKAAQKADAAVHTDEINLYTGACYVLTHDENQAEVYLQKVVDSSSSREKDRQAAMELLEKIK